MTYQTAASTEMEVMQGDSWFSLFFWPAFRRIFLLNGLLHRVI